MGIKKMIFNITGLFFVMAILVSEYPCSIYAADLQMFENARLIDNPSNDGDSFRVDIGKKNIHARLVVRIATDTL
ncbi:MAG: hypothetical protein L6420_11110 [Elusimicrobia bacterium]|nr:hypothetical protein [Elusimicrobiota bacterium]